MRDHRFLIKRLPNDVVELQKFADLHKLSVAKMSDDELAYKKIKLNSALEVKLMAPWTNLLPQVPFQNFVSCYGVIKV